MAACKCGPGLHPQVPPKAGAASYHQCETCGGFWKYGQPAPQCTGAPVVEEVA